MGTCAEAVADVVPGGPAFSIEWCPPRAIPVNTVAPIPSTAIFRLIIQADRLRRLGGLWFSLLLKSSCDMSPPSLSR
jgi:hypothetical protein